MSDTTDAATLAASIVTNAQNPASVSVDGNSVTQVSLSEQIAAAKFVASKVAARSDGRGLIFNTLVPPAAP